MLREVAASVRLVVSLRAVAWAWSQPVVQAQMRRDPTLLHYSASIARSKCKNAFGVKTITVMLRNNKLSCCETITVMLRKVAASVRLVVSLRAVAWAWSQPVVQAQMRRDPTLLHYTASIARSKCKNAVGVKTITVMLRNNKLSCCAKSQHLYDCSLAYGLSRGLGRNQRFKLK